MRRRLRHGFSLIELLLTIALAGVLASIATVELSQQVMVARRTEGIIGLNALWKAQQLHLLEKGRYAASFDQLDFAVEGGSFTMLAPNVYQGNVYTYQMTQPWGPNSFYCIATGQLDGDAWPDVLEVMETGGSP